MMGETLDLSPRQPFLTHIPCKNLRRRYTQLPILTYGFRDSSPIVPSNSANIFNNETWVHDQPENVWAPPRNLHESAPGAHDPKNLLTHTHQQTLADRQNSVNVAIPRAPGGEGCDFKMSRGYNRIKNDYNLLDCVENCLKGRYGARGFKRRGNLIVHLRNCHHQTIPKYDRGGAGNKKRVQRLRGVSILRASQ